MAPRGAPRKGFRWLHGCGTYGAMPGNAGVPPACVHWGSQVWAIPRHCAYNCVAWAAGQTDTWWDHLFGYWPNSASRDGSVAAYAGLFASLGFELCETSLHEPGVEKIAVSIPDYGRPVRFLRRPR